MEDTFKIRAYGYSELAQLYFPNVTKKSASVQLRRWIVLNKKLEAELLQIGFKPGQRLLTPKQVSVIINMLGTPCIILINGITEMTLNIILPNLF